MVPLVWLGLKFRHGADRALKPLQVHGDLDEHRPRLIAGSYFIGFIKGRDNLFIIADQKRSLGQRADESVLIHFVELIAFLFRLIDAAAQN